jgi:hypothetical protein
MKAGLPALQAGLFTFLQRKVTNANFQQAV